MRSPIIPLFSAACLLLLGCSESSPAEARFGAFSFSQLRAQHCQPEQTGTAYAATRDAITGQAIDSAAAADTAPCFQLTGFGSSESSLAISSDGTVFIAPALTRDGHGFLRTRDFGVTLEPILPSTRGGTRHTRVKPYLFMEPQSERLLFASSRPGLGDQGFDLSFSDDLGETFASVRVGKGTLDWLKLISAPSTTQPDARVLYASSATPLATPLPLTELKPDYQQIQRSRDNGETWENVGAKQLSLVPTDHDCKSSEWLLFGGGVATSDGTIFFGLRRCTRLAVAISSDEGESWQVRDIDGATLVDYESIFSHLSRPNLIVPEPFAVDGADNLYAVWSDRDDTLRFAVSVDRAQSWSKPVVISAPNAPKTVFPALAIKEPGVLAVAYYGGDGDSFEAYIAESHDALEPLPTFVSHAVSSPAGPLFTGGFDVGLDLLSGGDLVEMVQVKYAPNGDIWAAFVKDMCPGRGTQTCQWDKPAHANSQFQGAIGRLVHR